MDPLSRITPATVDVMRALLAAETSLWGLAIISSTGRPPGSVYPILERLERAEWVTSSWEVDSGRTGPRRRLYELTADGASAARAAVGRFDEAAARRARGAGRAAARTTSRRAPGAVGLEGAGA